MSDYIASLVGERVLDLLGTLAMGEDVGDIAVHTIAMEQYANAWRFR